METVFVVFITDEDGRIDTIHSIWKKEEEASDTVKVLTGSMRDSEAYYEEFELN